MGMTTAIQSRCSAALVSLRLSEPRSERMAASGADPLVVRETLKRAVATIAPNIRGMLAGKFRGSGLKKGKGKEGGHLSDLMPKTRVEVIWRGSKPVLTVSMPAGLPEKAYAKAAALNYGAVRQPEKAGIIDQKAKRTLKRQVTGEAAQEQTNRKGVYYDSRRARKLASGSSKVTVLAHSRSYDVKAGELIQNNASTSGAFSVTRARHFFDFTATEKSTIAALIDAEVARMFKEG